MKEEGEEIYSAESDLLPKAPLPPPIIESSPFSRGPLLKSKSILKVKNSSPEEKKKRVRMLFPEDTVTPIWVQIKVNKPPYIYVNFVF